MYSPKIREELIKPLYLYSKHLRQPMTRTVDQLLYSGLLRASPPAEVKDLLSGLEGNYLADRCEPSSGSVGEGHFEKHCSGGGQSD